VVYSRSVCLNGGRRKDLTEGARGTMGVGLARGSAQGGLAARHSHGHSQEAEDEEHAHTADRRAEGQPDEAQIAACQGDTLRVQA
jgi:hypothetical protein